MSDLCSLSDVTSYVPGYTSDADTDAKLQALITAQSVDIVERTGLEFSPIAGANPRRFDVHCGLIDSRELPIGAASAINTVTQYRSNGDLVGALAISSFIALPRTRQAWQPITDLAFPLMCDSPVVLVEEDILEVDATWGYPSVPANIKEACAKLVIVRYVNDVAGGGTAFADAVTGDINIGGLLVSAEETIRRYQIP